MSPQPAHSPATFSAGKVPRRPTLAPALTLLLVIAAAALGACTQQPAMDASQIPHTEIPKTDATLQVANNNGAIRYQGVVADEATRAALLRSLQSVYGSTAGGDITLAPDTHPPLWAAKLGELFLAFRLPGAVLDFRGKRIELGGVVSDENRANLLRTTRRLYPDYELTGLFQGVDMKHALPASGDPAALLAFLNGLAIRFQDDSGMVTAASLDGFARGARALKAAADGTQIEAGVYAEKSDMPDYDLQIAAQRAEAVRLQLAIRGVSPLSIQPRVLPASGEKGGQVEFRLLPAASSGAEATAPGDTGSAPKPRPSPVPREAAAGQP